MAKAELFGAGLSEQTERWIEEQAEKTGRPKEAIVESLAEEAARMRRFPGIGFRGEADSRRAWVMGTGLDVWEAIMLYQDVGSVKELTEGWSINEEQVRLALAYYEEYPVEISLDLTKNNMPPEYWHERYPDIFPPPPAE